MRIFLMIVLAVWLAAVHTPVAAQQTEALRQELEQLRQQFEGVKRQYEGYQKAIESLSERLQRLEAAPAPAAAAPVVQPPPAAPAPVVQAPAAPGPPAGGLPSLMELARPREPYSLYERRGPGQLLFDIGIVSDFIADFTSGAVEDADAGTFAGRENRVFPREVEVNFFGRIDPYAEGIVRFEFAEEFEDGERTLETKLAEAYLTLLTLPYGTSLRLGQTPVRFGLLSHLHREALPQPDSPNVLLRFLGEEQFRDAGGELSWVAPTPFYLEALVGVYNGDNEVAFGRGSFRSPMVNGRLRTFLELGEQSAIQLGVSGATGETEQELRNNLVGLEAKYKLTPGGWRHPLLTVAGELLYGNRKVEETSEVEVDDGMGGLTLEEVTRERTRNRYGWYVYGEVQPWKRWLGGLRYDWTESPVNPGKEWAVEPYVTFLASDFLRFRLAYKHTERSSRQFLYGPGTSTPRSLDEVFLQATFYLGAHPAHPF
jgi:hypothetical protein